MSKKFSQYKLRLTASERRVSRDQLLRIYRGIHQAGTGLELHGVTSSLLEADPDLVIQCSGWLWIRASFTSWCEMVLFYAGMDKTWSIWIQFFLLSGILMREMIVTLNEWLWVTDMRILAQGGVTSQPPHAPLSSFVMVVSTVSLTEDIYRHTFPSLICTIQAIGHDQRKHTQWKSFWRFSALPRAERWLLSGRFPLFCPTLTCSPCPFPCPQEFWPHSYLGSQVLIYITAFSSQK